MIYNRYFIKPYIYGFILEEGVMVCTSHLNSFLVSFCFCPFIPFPSFFFLFFPFFSFLPSSFCFPYLFLLSISIYEQCRLQKITVTFSLWQSCIFFVFTWAWIVKLQSAITYFPFLHNRPHLNSTLNPEMMRCPQNKHQLQKLQISLSPLSHKFRHLVHCLSISSKTIYCKHILNICCYKKFSRYLVYHISRKIHYYIFHTIK